MSAPRILVLDADAPTRVALADALSQRGFATRSAHPLDAEHRRCEDADVLIVDTGGVQGDEELKLIRSLGTPRRLVVIAMGHALGPAGRVAALASGCDDVVEKPPVPDELALRIRVALRRRDVSPVELLRLRVGPLEVDLPASSLRVVDGPEIELRARECALLAYLAHRAGQLVDRAQLMSDVWGQPNGNDSTLTVHIGRLRSHIAALGCADTVRIETAHGRGYRLKVHGRDTP